jgi:hypothetical protein
MTAEDRWFFVLFGCLSAATTKHDANREVRQIQRLLLAQGVRASGSAHPPLDDLEFDNEQDP